MIQRGTARPVRVVAADFEITTASATCSRFTTLARKPFCRSIAASRWSPANPRMGRRCARPLSPMPRPGASTPRST